MKRTSGSKSRQLEHSAPRAHSKALQCQILERRNSTLQCKMFSGLVEEKLKIQRRGVNEKKKEGSLMHADLRF